jgi:hypothetical protein
MPDSEKAKWIELGTLLYAPRKGLLGPFQGRPSVQHGYVMSTGFLVLALLDRRDGAKLKVLADTLKPVMSRSTVEARLAHLKSIGIVYQYGSQYRVTPDWLPSLLAYEFDVGLLQKATLQDQQHARDRRNWKIELAGGEDNVTLKAHVRQQPCYVCREIPCGEVDHIPPKEWGGFDHPQMMFPACRKHNGQPSSLIRDAPHTPTLTVPLDSIVSVSHYGTGADVFLAAQMLYIHAMRTGDLNAFHQARRLFHWSFPHWLEANDVAQNSR